MPFSRLLRMAVTLVVLVALVVAAWLGVAHLTTDGLNPLEALGVGIVGLVAVTIAAFALG